MPQKILSSLNKIFEKKYKKQHVDNILFCTGGGILQIFFTLGAIKQLHDNNRFLNTFDIISSTSGGAITSIFIELCYDNNLVGVVPDWYDRYVVKPIHDCFNGLLINMLQNMALSCISLKNILQDPKSFNLLYESIYLYYKDIPKLKPSPKSLSQKKPLFFYNYINEDTLEITAEDVDLENRDKYDIAKTILKCVMPFFIIDNKISLDAAFSGNNIATNVLDKYKPTLATYITRTNYFTYDNYPKNSILDVFSEAFTNMLNSSIINTIHLSSIILKDTKVTVITLSNSLHPSKNKYHKNVFIDDTKQLGSLIYNYITPYNLLLVFENEGYIQANTEIKNSLRRSDNKPVFKIPNPSVYKIAKNIVPRIINM